MAASTAIARSSRSSATLLVLLLGTAVLLNYIDRGAIGQEHGFAVFGSMPRRERRSEHETVQARAVDFERAAGELEELVALHVRGERGFDLVSGWKTHRKDPLRRRVPSKIFNWVTGRVSGLRLHDLNCGLKAYRADVVRNLRIYGELHRFLPVLAHDRGYRVAELPVNHRPREHGKSRYGVERYLRGFLDFLTVWFMGLYRHRPLHLFGGLGLVLGAIGTVLLVYLTVLKLSGEAIGHRPLLTLGVLLMVVGLQFFSLGLLSELITSHHEERTGTADELHVDEVLAARAPERVSR